MRKTLSLLMLFAGLLAFTGSAQAATYQLKVSTSNTRTPSEVLAGQSYATGQNIYAFATSDDTTVNKVSFYLDGALQRTEAMAPYDFAGSNDQAGTANPYATASGSHTIVAKFFAGTAQVGTATGSFCGGACAVATTYELRVAQSNTRSPSVALSGQTYTQGSSIYVFTSPDTSDITKVEFFLDGALQRTELTKPYDFAGSTDPVANPYAVPSGTHTIQAKLYAGTTVKATVQGQFTGSGSTPPPPPPPPPPSGSCTPTTSATLSGNQTREILSNSYHVQSNEWGSSAPFSITNNGCPQFAISQSQINVSTSGAPGAYPSIYKGCHWGYCTSNSGLPLQASTVRQGGKVTSSADTTLITTGAWDSAYDIWFNVASSTTNNSASGLEMMVWLAKLGPIQPAGAKVASAVSIGGNSYDVWKGGSSPGGTVSYVMTSSHASVTNLDLGPLTADSVTRGYITDAWWLIDVEYGFEPWQGGQGLTLNSGNICTPAGC